MTTTTNDQRILGECGCGWAIVTTYLGQSDNLPGPTNPPGEATRCKVALKQQVRQGGLTARLSTTVLLIPPLHLVRERKTSLPSRMGQQHSPQREHHKTPSREPTRGTPEKPVRKSKVKWPKASDKDAWRNYEEGKEIWRDASEEDNSQTERETGEEILQLVMEQRKAKDQEKEGLKNLWNQIKVRLTLLR